MYANDFDKEFYNGELCLREFDVVLSFGDDYNIEKSAMVFLDNLGFRVADNGYNFLVYIIVESVKRDGLLPSINSWYEICAEKFSVSAKSVEAGITNAIRTAGKFGKLNKMNEIFNFRYVEYDTITNAVFINVISRRFGIMRKYDKELCFKA